VIRLSSSSSPSTSTTSITRTTAISTTTITTTEAYRNFIHSLKSPKTRFEYIRSLRYYMAWLKLDVLSDNSSSSYDKLLQKDPKLITSDIIEFIIYLKDRRKLSPATVTTYISAIRHFYDMNDIDQLKWKKINSFKGEYYNVVEDRPYTREEVKVLVDRADLRNRAIILLMSSSGLRLGAIPELKIKDLTPIDKYSIYQVTVYRKSKSKYITFCTPEARKQIDDYIKWRVSVGEKIKPESPLFRRTFDRNDLLQARNPQPLRLGTLNWILNTLLYSTGVRTTAKVEEKTTNDNNDNDDNNSSNKRRRRDIMQAHGFRKFFDTTCTTAGMNPVYTEMLMGHNLGLKSRYAKPTPTDLLEGNDKNLGYTTIMDHLTINEENRLRRQVETLRVEKSQIEELAQTIAEVKSKLGLV
jgi:integrase